MILVDFWVLGGYNISDKTPRTSTLYVSQWEIFYVKKDQKHGRKERNSPN